jgi:phospholipid/cholesterol/gamma-HCH transport system substrate-binding protein
MVTGIKLRLIAFAVLSAVGIIYITASYLGFIDRVLGRGLTVYATLPSSGGLFEGSEVSYRGVKIGKVKEMNTSRDGVELVLALEEGTRLPADSPMYVHNLSAVGEQYLDFEPADDEGPYVEDGARLEGSEDSLPTDEADLLVSLNAFVKSVDEENLQVTVAELGDMFADTGEPLQRLLDNGSRFIDEAAAHSDETTALLDNGLTVLGTQQDNSENIASFSRDLKLLTEALANSDQDVRQVLQGTPGTARELDALLTDLEPTLPVLLGNAVSINQVAVAHLAGLEQLLVSYPRVIGAGPSGSTADGYGHVNLQFDSSPTCTEGYLKPSEWRQFTDLSDGPIYPARCLSGPPLNMRGSKYSPGTPLNGNPARSSTAYDPDIVPGVLDKNGNPVRYVETGDLSVLGEDSWKWLLVGPVSTSLGTTNDPGVS